jgi:hypothetical protein
MFWMSSPHRAPDVEIRKGKSNSQLIIQALCSGAPRRLIVIQ